MPKKLALIDVDGTLIRGQSQQLLLNFLFKKNLIGFLFILRLNLWYVWYKLGFIKDIKPIVEYALSYFKNKKLTEIELVLGEYIETVLKPRIFTEGIELLKKLKQEGYTIILLSGAIEPVISRLLPIVCADDYICTKIEVKDGIITGRIIGDLVYGDNKATILKSYVQEHNLSLEDSVAYADHVSDLKLLQTTTRGFFVNPHRQALAVAKEKNISVVYFR